MVRNPLSWLLMGKMAFLPEMLLSSHRRAHDGAGPLSWSLSSSVASFNKGLTCVLMAVSSAASASTVTIPFSERNLSSVPLWMLRCIFRTLGTDIFRRALI